MHALPHGIMHARCSDARAALSLLAVWLVVTRVFLRPAALTLVSVVPLIPGGKDAASLAWASRRVAQLGGQTLEEDSIRLDAEQQGRATNPEGQMLRIVRGFLSPSEIEAVLNLIKTATFDSVEPDENPVETPVQILAKLGVWDDADPLVGLLRPFVAGRLIPYMQEALGCPTLTMTSVFVRRYAIGLRRDHQVHMDDAFGTAIVDLTPVQGSGLFVGPGADAASQFYVPFASPGDVAVHGWDLPHGVRLNEGHERVSIIVWAEPLADIEAGRSTWYLEAAMEGEPHAAYRVGMDAEAEGELEMAMQFYELAGEEGHLFGIYRLGQLLAAEGKIAESRQWLTEAAAKGCSAAAVDLSDAFQLEGNFEVALSYLRAAELLHDCRAMQRLGVAYSRGLGVSANAVKSAKYFRSASDSGWSEEMLQRSLWS